MDDSEALAFVLLFILLPLLGSIVLGLLTSLIWSSKGGHALFGFVLGFFFGPLGLLVGGFAKPGVDHCPWCENSVPARALICPTCHREIEEDGGDEVAADE